MTKPSLAAGDGKGKDMNFLEQNIEEYISPETNSSDTCIVFECDELDYHDFPIEEDVPEGIYAAMIMGFQNHKDKFKNQYTDVCYKIFSDLAFMKWTNKIADQITYSYIRIRFMNESDDIKRFRVAMSALCQKKKFTSNELIGTIVLINLAYRGKGEAFVEKYKHTDLNDLWFVDDISDEFHWSSGYDPGE